jgi:hypothetical protein
VPNAPIIKREREGIERKREREKERLYLLLVDVPKLPIHKMQRWKFYTIQSRYKHLVFLLLLYLKLLIRLSPVVYYRLCLSNEIPIGTCMY